MTELQQVKCISGMHIPLMHRLLIMKNGRADELMHKDTRELLEKLLHMLAEEGEETTYRYIRREVLKKIRRGSVGSSEAIYCASWRDGLEQEKKLVQGRKDIPLNEYGRHLALETSYGMRQYQIDLAYTSPLRRAKETAEILLEGRNIPLYEDQRIQEIFLARMRECLV